MSGLYGNVAGGFGNPKTYILTDNNGKEITGVLVDNVTVFDATPEDVRVDKVFASDEGVQTGVDTKTYRTTMASRVIKPGESLSIPLTYYNAYDYTKFQGVIVLYNTSYSTTVNTIGVTVGDSVFSIDTSKLASITKNAETKSVDFNIVNTTTNTYEIFYSTYREE